MESGEGTHEGKEVVGDRQLSASTSISAFSGIMSGLLSLCFKSGASILQRYV